MSETNPTCWILTEGKAGTENQCLGVAEALGVIPVVKRFTLRFPWKQFSPWLGFGNQYALADGSARLDPPYPDLLIASGRKSVGLALHVRKMSGGKTFLVQIQNPCLNPKHFDLVVVPQHDPVRGDNVWVTTGSLHCVTPEKIVASQKKFATILNALPRPRVAVLIGGSSNAYQMTPESTKKLTDQLLSLKVSLMVTASRRTGIDQTRMLRSALKGPHIYFWDGEGENPYFALLGFADHVIVTEDSVSMVSEALSTGKPVHIARLPGGTRRFRLFHQGLQQKNYTKPFAESLETWSYIPPDDTLKVADEIRRRMKLKGCIFMSKTHHIKVLIIGSGPAGYTAAVYAARANLKPVLVAGLQPGGQMTITTDVENYPGFATPVQGPWLMEEMRKQAENVGTEMISDTIVSIDLSTNPKKAVGDSGDIYLADTVIITTGAQAKWLGLPSEKQYNGHGVSGCATCDGPFFRGKEVVVVGGGNTAVEEALFLAKLTNKVTLIHRRDTLRAEKIMQDRLFNHPKIEVIWDSAVEEITGDGKIVTGVKIRNVNTGQVTDLKTDGVFVAIGHKPSSELFKGQLDIDKDGYIVTKPGSTTTSVPGVFAAGDVQDKIFRQAVVAAGAGCMAAMEAEKYIAELEALLQPSVNKTKTQKFGP